MVAKDPATQARIQKAPGTYHSVDKSSKSFPQLLQQYQFELATSDMEDQNLDCAKVFRIMVEFR